MSFKIINKLFFTLTALLLFLLPGSSSADEVLNLYVHPYLPSVELVKRFTPLAEHLGKEIGRTVNLRISKDYQDHITHAGNGDADIAYLGPASYVKLTELHGRKPLLARLEIKGKPVFKGAVIVRKNSTVKTLTELSGKSFAFGDPDSTMSHLVPRSMLIKAGVEINKLSRYRHLKNHNNVALSVLAGDYDAGAVKEEVFYDYEDRGLMLLAWTPDISEHLFVADSSLASETVDSLRTAMLGLKDTRAGREIMHGIKSSMTALVPVRYEDYDNLREIIRILQKDWIKP